MRRLSKIFGGDDLSIKQKDAEVKISFELVKINRHGTRQTRTLLITDKGVSNCKGKTSQWYFSPEDIAGIAKDKTTPTKIELRCLKRYYFETANGKETQKIMDCFKQLYNITGTEYVASSSPNSTPPPSPKLGSQATTTTTTPSTPTPYDKNKITIDHFELVKVLGKGSFSNVVLVKKKDDNNKLYAMKILNKSELKKRNQVEHTNTEKEILTKYSHPFIVKLYYSFQTQDKLYMCLEYVSGGELFYHLKRARRFPENLACFYAAEVVSALEYLHTHDIIYRDLKPENILVDTQGHLKLTDFGLSKTGITSIGGNSEGNKTRTFCGTPDYLAPEVIQGLPHGKAVDWWALGILLYEMLTGQPPFKGQSRNELYEQTLKADVVFPEHVSSTAKGIVTSLLNRKPEQRLGANGADEVKNHPFFDKIDWEKLVLRQVEPPFKPIVVDNPLENLPAPSVKDKELFAPAPTTTLSVSPSFKNFTYQGDASLLADKSSL